LNIDGWNGIISVSSQMRGGNHMNMEERLDFIEFRMDLLREGTEFAKFIYDCNVTKSQLDELYDILDDIQGKIDNGLDVSSSEYESQVLNVVDHRKLDYHFCESFVRLLWEEQRYEDIFPALYKDSNKFSHLFK
jgi:hypothetical protein